LFSGESRLTFLAWANELITAHICGESSMDTAGYQTFTRISFDGAGVGQAWNAADVTRVNGAADGSTAWQSCYTSDSQSGFSEAALHYVTETHAVNSGTAYFGPTSLGVFNSLTACIRD
jgi:hypothetical protein